MKCQDIELLLSAYIDGELTEEEQRDVETHLSTCVACQMVVEEFSQLHTWYAELERQPASPGFRQRVTQRLDALPHRLLPWRWPKLVYAVSCALFVIVGGILLSVHVFQPPPSEVAQEVNVYAEDILFGSTTVSLDDMFAVEDTNIAEEILDTIEFTETNI
jgi:anti-sigma factor RsiW